MVRRLAADKRPAGRTERTCHLLVADTEQGIVEPRELNRRWTAESRQEDLMTLAKVPAELGGASLLQGRPRYGRTSSRPSATPMTRGLPASRRHARDLRGGRGHRRPRLVAEVQSLVGDIMQARGDLAAAEHAYRQALAIAQQLAQADPGNAGR